MFIKANFTSIVTSNDIRTEKKIGGSASYILDNNGLPVKHIKSDNVLKLTAPRITAEVLVAFAHHEIGDIILLDKDTFLRLEKAGIVARYEVLKGMNKTKVRSKLTAYANLQKSKKFLAFYSISFPASFSDEHIRKIHNTVLTRLRKMDGSFTYIWIAERQKNGTLHFHMLTNRHFNIRVINFYYAKAINNIYMKHYSDILSYNYKKYNGVDVKLVKSITSLTKYLTKYVTKNNEKMSGLSWNCDKSVSALITHVYLSQEEYKTLSGKLAYMDTIKKKTHIEGVYIEFDIYNYLGYKPKLIFCAISEINEYIYTDILAA